jgi:hypothetical protein
VDEIRISPQGDPFYAARSPRRRDNQETPHGCYDGWVYLGFEVAELDEQGEYVEVIERVPCRRCKSPAV